MPGFRRFAQDAARLGFDARTILRTAVDADVKRDEDGRFAVHGVNKNGQPSKMPTPTYRKEEHFDRENAEKHRANLESMNPGKKFVVMPNAGHGKAHGHIPSAQEGFARRANAFLKQKWPK